MAEAIINSLEEIKVNNRYRTRVVASLCPCEFFVQRLHDVTTVQRAGQLVNLRKFLDTSMRNPQFVSTLVKYFPQRASVQPRERVSQLMRGAAERSCSQRLGVRVKFVSYRAKLTGSSSCRTILICNCVALDAACTEPQDRIPRISDNGHEPMSSILPLQLRLRTGIASPGASSRRSVVKAAVQKIDIARSDKLVVGSVGCHMDGFGETPTAR
jgi:hypothetical protein